MTTAPEAWNPQVTVVWDGQNWVAQPDFGALVRAPTLDELRILLAERIHDLTGRRLRGSDIDLSLRYDEELSCLVGRDPPPPPARTQARGRQPGAV